MRVMQGRCAAIEGLLHSLTLYSRVYFCEQVTEAMQLLADKTMLAYKAKDSCPS